MAWGRDAFCGMGIAAWGVIDSMIRRKGWKMPFGKFVTFLEVFFAWIFFRADSLRQALGYIYHMVTAGIRTDRIQSVAETLGLTMSEIIIIILGIILVCFVDELCNRKHTNFSFLIQQRQNAFRYAVFYLLLVAIFIFGIYGSGYQTEQFIYMQF